jgi:hypothetical protein
MPVTLSLSPAYRQAGERGEGKLGDPPPLGEDGQKRYYFLFSSIAFSNNLIPSWEALIDWQGFPRHFGVVETIAILGCPPFPEDMGFVVGSGKKNLFWSYRQDDSGPHKEENYNDEKLSDQFGVHITSLSPNDLRRMNCLFCRNGVWKL